MYRIYDTKIKHHLKTIYKTRFRASLQADKLDAEYGAYRYIVERIKAE